MQLALASLWSCTTPSRKQELVEKNAGAPTPSYSQIESDSGPLMPEPGPYASEDQVAEVGTESGLILIFGPGWARAWSAAGVLMEIAETETPIQKIYASEMSAVISVLFAADPRPSAFSWNLQRLKDECLEPNLSPFRRLMEKDLVDPQCLRGFLKAELKSKRFEDLKIPVEISVPQRGRTNFVDLRQTLDWASQGAVTEELMSSVSFPGLIQGKTPISGARALCSALCADGAEVFPVRHIKSLEDAKIVVLDLGENVSFGTQTRDKKTVLQAYEERLRALSEEARPELEHADVLLRISSPVSQSFEPKQKNEFLFLGRSAARNQMEKWQTKTQVQGRGD